ncbi:hypothetical protein [Roseomonas chloroacetimidivorans]|uniref:hypothetical protein n=1 Tax=Roseomonas chloroacetimidivorans TaxID=1766656 RepID=UPI003C72980E
MRPPFPRPAHEAAAFLAFLAAWTVLASFLLLVLMDGAPRLPQLRGLAWSWGWWSHLLADDLVPFSILLLGRMLLFNSGALAALILGAATWHLFALRRGGAR